MSNLPASWVETTLGEITSLITKGTTPTSLGFHFQSSGIPFVKIENIKDWKINKTSIGDFISDECHDALKRSQLAEGDVLFSIAGTIGKTAVVDKDSIPANTNQAVAIIRGTSNVILPRLLMLELAFLADDFAKKNARGGAMNNISLGDIRSLILSIPPLNEQKRITNKLNSLLARVDSCQTHLERVPQILKRFRQSVLAAATSGRLTEDWREEKGVDVSNWESKSLGELVLESANGFSKRRSDNGKETVVLRLADFKNAERYIGNERTVKMDEKELKKYGMVEGDLLVIRVNGSRDLAGRFIEYKNPGETLEAYCDHFIRLRLDTTKILSRFASFVANSGEGRRYIELELVTSAGQNTINQPSVFGLMMDVPSLEEQAEIVRRVEKLFAYAERLEARYYSASEHVERMTPSLLAKAFRGELVGQEVGDESAEKLLERIQSLRETSQEESKKVKTPRKKRELTKNEVAMLKKFEVLPNHLSSILKERGALTAESLWKMSQLEIDEFYEQLKNEEEKKLLRELRGEDENSERLLEAL